MTELLECIKIALCWKVCNTINKMMIVISIIYNNKQQQKINMDDVCRLDIHYMISYTCI